MLKAIGNRIVAQVCNEKPEGNSSIVVLEEKRENQIVARVISVPDNNSNNLEINAGDKIIVERYGVVEVKDNKEEYLIIKSEDVLAVVKD